MKVNLEKTFPMPVPADAAWRFLQDIEAVAACMPGAKITERVDDTHYKGTVTSRVGPATLSFSGTIEVVEVDADKMTLRMVGKGSDRSGSSGASMDLTARIETTDDNKSNLIGNSEVSMTGKAATFGGRMIVPVAEQILKKFAGNFARRLEEQQTETTTPSGTVSSDTLSSGTVQNGTVQNGSVLNETAQNGAIQNGAGQSETVRKESDSAPPESSLNVLGLLWGMIKDAVRRLFGKKPG